MIMILTTLLFITNLNEIKKIDATFENNTFYNFQSLNFILDKNNLYEKNNPDIIIDNIYNSISSLEFFPKDNEQRSKDIAYDLYYEAIDNPLFHGSGGIEATALFLAAIGYVESKFIERLERCECKTYECDAGKSLGIFQIRPMHRKQYSKKEYCSNRRLQIKIALNILKNIQLECKSNNMKVWAGAYNTGKCKNYKKYTNKVFSTFDLLMSKNNLKLDYSDGKWVAYRDI